MPINSHQEQQDESMTHEEEERVVQTLGSGTDKYYVYALCKRDGTPFYIGKGCGWRVFQHREAALQARDSIESDDTLTEAEKVAKIEELTRKLQTILEQEGNLKMVIVKWGLSSKEALMCESALINLLSYSCGKRIGALTNLVNGHSSEAEKNSASNVKTKARTLEAFLMECAIPERAINSIQEPVVFIKINDFYPKCINRDGVADNNKVKDCVRGIWKIHRTRRSRLRYVFAIYRRRAVGIFRIRRVSDDVGIEYHSGLKGFPVFPPVERAMDRNIARFPSVEEARRNLAPGDFEAFLKNLRERETQRRCVTENAVLADWRKRVYFEIDDIIPPEIALFKDCLLKKDGDDNFFSTRGSIRFNF